MNAAASAASLLKIVIREKQNRSPSASYDTHKYYYPVAIDSGRKCDLYLKARWLGKGTDTQWTWRGFNHIISHRANEGRNPVYTAIEGRSLNWTDVQFINNSSFQAAPWFGHAKLKDHIRVLPAESFKNQSKAYENSQRPGGIVFTPKRSSSGAGARGDAATPAKLLRFSDPLVSSPRSGSPKARRGGSNSPRFAPRPTKNEAEIETQEETSQAETTEDEKNPNEDAGTLDFSDMLPEDWDDWNGDDSSERPASSLKLPSPDRERDSDPEEAILPDDQTGPASLPSVEDLNVNKDYIYLGQLILEKLKLEHEKQKRATSPYYPGGFSTCFKMRVEDVKFTGIRLVDPGTVDELNAALQRCQSECNSIILKGSTAASVLLRDEIELVKGNLPEDWREEAYEKLKKEQERKFDHWAKKPINRLPLLSSTSTQEHTVFYEACFNENGQMGSLKTVKQTKN